MADADLLRAVLALARTQAGAISRAQATGAGLSPRQVDWLLTSGRWVRLYPGVFVVHRGPLGAEARVWAALLYAGAGATACGRTALWLWKVVDEPPAVVTVCVPRERRVRRQPGLSLLRVAHLDGRRHPAAAPARLRVEEAVLDTAGAARRPWDAVDVVLRAAQRRVTTAARLRAALDRRARHRWRNLLEKVLAEVVAGVLSALEREYRRTVERAHGLPAGEYNPGELLRELHGKRSRYRDVRYRPWRLVVELDGAEAHPPEEEWQDQRKDNGVTRSGRSSLRYGWRPVAQDPCAVAAEVADSLRVRGWGGAPTSCRAGCPVTTYLDQSGDSAQAGVAEFPP